jgi:hypothetical protein
MKYYKSINEFNRNDRAVILDNEEKFTIAYELEMKSKKAFPDYFKLDDYFKTFFGDIMKKYNLVTEYDYTIDDDFDDVKELETSDLYEYFDLETDIGVEMGDVDFEDSFRIKGIELKNKTYFKGLNEAFTFLDEFYAKKNEIKKFTFNHKTGIHVNIGYYEDVDWNLLKGYLLLNEDFTFKGFEQRKTSTFTKSYKDIFKSKVKEFINKEYKEKNPTYLEINEKFSIFEKELNDILVSIVSSMDEKTIGFNINKHKNNNYIEFRYPGGNVPKNALKEQTLHYANIVYSCCNPEYRQSDYIKKFYNLLTSIND